MVGAARHGSSAGERWISSALPDAGRESEAKLREIIAEDPLCLGVGGGKAGVKGIMEGMECFDDRAYVRVIADCRCMEQGK